MKHCTAGIETKLFVYSNCDIFGEEDEGGIKDLGKGCFSFFFSSQENLMIPKAYLLSIPPTQQHIYTYFFTVKVRYHPSHTFTFGAGE